MLPSWWRSLAKCAVGNAGTRQRRRFKGGRPKHCYRPALEQFESRLVPATHFAVDAPSAATAGSPFQFTVTALDLNNNTDPAYSGTVAFSSSDSQAAPAQGGTLTAGVGVFSFTLCTAGPQVLIATDALAQSITGFSNIINVGPAAAAADFLVSGMPGSTIAGTPFDFTVTAQDVFGNICTGYNGTVHFTSSDAQAQLIGNSILTNGVGIFRATFKTAGGQMLSAVDTAAANVDGSSSVVTVYPAAPAQLAIVAPSSTTAGRVFNFTTIAEDQFGNTTPSYSGIVDFGTSDSQGVPPPDATLTGGVGVFQMALRTAGSQMLTAADTAAAAINGADSIAVNPAGAAYFVLSGEPASITAGTAFAVTVTAFDSYGNTATGYSGTVHFTSTDSQAGLPSDGTLTAGTGVFDATLKTAGVQLLTATDALAHSITGYSNVIDVGPQAAATNFVITGTPSATVAGAPLDFTVTALDQFGNTCTAYAGTVHFTSTDPQAQLTGNSILTSGVGIFRVALLTAGDRTLTASDTVTASITATSNIIVVSPAATADFIVNAPANAVAGTAFSFTVTAEDRYGNITPNYTGTVQFGSSVQSVLPSGMPLVSGVGTFSATPLAGGMMTLTVTDAGNSSITGSAVIAVPTGGIKVSIPTNLLAFRDGVVSVPVNVDKLDDPLNNNSGLVSADLVLYYNPSVFTVSDTDVSLGVIPGGYSPSVPNGWSVQPDTATPGLVNIFLSNDGFGPVTGTSGGSLATVDFHVNANAPFGPSMINLAADTGGGQPITYVSDQNFYNYQLSPQPQDDTQLSPAYSYSGFDPDDGTVTILGAANFSVSAPANVQAGTPLHFTVTALDQQGTSIAAYNGTVHFSSSDSQAALPANATLTGGVGVFTATLRTPGNQTLTATDTVTSSLTGSSGNIAVQGLSVTSITPDDTGFVAQFSAAFDPTTLRLYFGAADVTLAGPAPSQAGVQGSLVPDPTNTSFTFLKTGTAAAGLLAPGTYTVTVFGGASGIKDANGGLLATGNSARPGSNYVTTFTVVGAANPVLSIPDFARGPDGAANITVPSTTSSSGGGQGGGIPITLTNPGSGPITITDLTFSLSYNPALLNISGTGSGASGTSFVLAANTGGLAGFAFSSGTGLTLNAGATLTLGQILAQVPNSAASTYKAKALLHLGNIAASDGGTSLGVVGNDGLELVAYLGDVAGQGDFSPLDAALISRVAVGFDTGFAAYPLVDPAIVGDVSGSGTVNSTDVTLMNRLLAGIAAPQIPQIPAGLTINPTGPDPNLSIGRVDFSPLSATPGDTIVVQVNIDTARPQGSTGLLEAVLALSYDPKLFTLTAGDVHLGTVPASGSGWQLQTVINNQTGEIGIDLFSTTPVQSAAGGSLVTIALQSRGSAALATPPLSLVSQADPAGQRVYQTSLADADGALVVHYEALAESGPAASSAVSSGNGPLPILSKSTLQPTDLSLPIVAQVFAGPALADAKEDEFLPLLTARYPLPTAYAQPATLLDTKFSDSAVFGANDLALLTTPVFDSWAWDLLPELPYPTDQTSDWPIDLLLDRSAAQIRLSTSDILL